MTHTEPPASLTEAHPSPAAVQFLEAVWLLWQSLASEGERALQREPGLDLRGFMALSYLQARPYQPAQLADQLMLHRYEMSRLLRQLEHQGLITREGIHGDGRRVRVTLTPVGQQAFQTGLLTAEQVTRPYLEHLTPHQVQTLTGSLGKLTRNQQHNHQGERA